VRPSADDLVDEGETLGKRRIEDDAPGRCLDRLVGDLVGALTVNFRAGCATIGLLRRDGPVERAIHERAVQLTVHVAVQADNVGVGRSPKRSPPCDFGVEVHSAFFERMPYLVQVPENAALTLGALLDESQVISTEDHVLGRRDDRAASRGREYVVRRQHQYPGLRLRFG
jgi:hypothetical protein